MSKKITPKSRESIKEAVDIVKNTENDDVAVQFLRETLEDDFPELDLGSMDLHEAIKEIGNQDKKKFFGNIEKANSLGEALSKFMQKQNEEKKKKRTRKRSKKK